MYWQSKGLPPPFTEQQVIACKLHSFCALFSVVQHELHELTAALECGGHLPAHGGMVRAV